MYLIFHGPLFFPPRNLPPYCRSERNTGNKRAHSTAEHNRAICSAQAPLGIITSLFAPNNHGPLPAPFTCFSGIRPCTSVAGDVSRPRSGALSFFRTNRDQYVCVLVFLLSSLILSSISVLFAFFSSPITPVLLYCRPERGIANIQHSTDRAISSSQAPLGNIKSLVALIHGPPLSAPFIFS